MDPKAQTPNQPIHEQVQTQVAQRFGQVAQGGQQFLKKFPGFEGKNLTIMAVISLIVVLAGVGTGWWLSGARAGYGIPREAAPGAKSGPLEAGLSDEKTFRDSAEGIMREGGIDGEGTHNLERPGGPSQTVFLTSTVIDLQSFVGKKVKVWGETISAKKAGWLMDVGKIKVIN